MKKVEFDKIKRFCGICGTLLTFRNMRDIKRKKYCSNKCRLVNLHSPEFNQRKSEMQKGKPHPHKGNKFKKGHHFSYETRQKISKALTGRKFSLKHRKNLSKARRGNPGMRGVNHWAWKGGIKPYHRRIQNWAVYKEWRLSVLERDKFTCIGCGKVGNPLDVHHIIDTRERPDLAFEVNNGTTLCRKCHTLLHRGKLQLKRA